MDGNDWGSDPEARGDSVPGGGHEHGNGVRRRGDPLAALPVAESPAGGGAAGMPVGMASEAMMDVDGAPATAAQAMADEVTATGQEPTSAEAAPEPGAFQAELAAVMHGAARAERDRVLGEVERRRAASVEEVRSRGSGEGDRLHAGADEVETGIEAWAEAEIARIQLERQRRIDAHHQDLEARVQWQAALVEREVAGIESGAAEYRAEIEAFFTRLDAETDPATIAALATRVPPLPRLDEVAAAARARAEAELPRPAPVAEAAGPAATEPEAAAPATVELESPDTDTEATITQSRLIAVMDPLAVATPEGAAGWSMPATTEAVPAAVEPASTPAESASSAGEREEGVAGVTGDTTAAEAEPESGRLLNAIPTARPFSWLLRPENREGRSGPDHQG